MCDRKLEADLFVLDTIGYDVILGMTWLDKYHAVIDCRGKTVNFKISHQQEFQFAGERKFANKGNQLNHATVKDKKKGVLVWNEFPDVFKEISRLSPDRIVKFSFDIIQRTTLISKSPYRMTSTELAILKEQLQEYSDK